MKISTFKSQAKLTHDNKSKAMSNWSKTWGFDFWRNLWAYREYTYEHNGVQYVYRVGNVYTRHTSCRVVECFMNDEEVSFYKFKKAISLI